jgi:ABC-type hemin transport system ATPase subunit
MSQSRRFDPQHEEPSPPVREDLLLLILDEPAAALDASAEHDLLERYASSAAQAGLDGCHVP